jgi:hypothetical protein
MQLLGLMDYRVELSQQCLGVLRGIAFRNLWALAAATG